MSRLHKIGRAISTGFLSWAYPTKPLPPYEQIAREVVFQQLLRHPFPWRIEHDWTEEVIASDNHIIAKCPSRADAQAIIDFAEKIMSDHNKADNGPEIRSERT